MGRCIWPHCAARGVLVPLPLTGDLVRLCARHRGARFIGHMRGLIQHG